MVRTLRSGAVIEKSEFYVGEQKPRADRRKGSSSRAKMDANRNAAVRVLARVLNCNMEAGDLLVTLKYDDEHLPEDKESADRECGKFWDRLSRQLRKGGVHLMGVWITSESDPETGEAVRLHHHMVIRTEGIRTEFGADGVLQNCSAGGRSLTEIWGRGGVDIQCLRDQKDFTPIARYLLAQVRGGQDEKKWHAARGMKKPVVESEKVIERPRELHPQPGATVMEIGPWEPESTSHYIRYIRKPKSQKRGGRKEEQDVVQKDAGRPGEL